MASAYVHITDNCNLHCVGCYSHVEKRNKKTDLTYKEICYELDQLADNGVKIIVISGGEPFIREDIELICKYAKGLDMIEHFLKHHRAVITDSAMEGESLSCKSRCGAGRNASAVAVRTMQSSSLHWDKSRFNCE